MKMIYQKKYTTMSVNLIKVRIKDANKDLLNGLKCHMKNQNTN